MVKDLRSRGIEGERVLAAMGKVPRHTFVSQEHCARAYEDAELPAGGGQPLVSPYLAARTIEYLDLEPDSKVLQVGAGCGYRTVLLCELAGSVWVADHRKEVVVAAQGRVREMGYSRVTFRNAKACRGWREHAPYDAILVTCAFDQVPGELFAELRDGGRMVVPLGLGPVQTWNGVRNVDGRTRSEKLLTLRADPAVCSARRP